MKERLPSIGGMVTAVLASACCIGPALFLAFGVTGLGFLSVFEGLRPYLLALTFVFVGVAYHYAYGRGARCRPGSSCDARAGRMGDRASKALFWVLLGFTAFGVAFPYAAAWLLA
ncbi:MAG: mercuric transporter MerT family protein [Thermodesulfobacteriota bacterium]